MAQWLRTTTTTHEGPRQKARQFNARLTSGASDASSPAWGGIVYAVEPPFMAGAVFPPDWLAKHIDQKEMYALYHLLLLQVCENHPTVLRRAQGLINVDIEAVVGAFNRGRAKNRAAHDLLIELFNLQVSYDFMLSLTAVATARPRGSQRKLQDDTTEFPVSAGEEYMVEFDGDTEEIVMAESETVPDETTVVVEDGDITTIVIGNATYSVSYDEDGEVDDVVLESGAARARRTQSVPLSNRRLQSCEQSCAGGANQLCGALEAGCRFTSLADLLGALCDDVDDLCSVAGILTSCERTCAPCSGCSSRDGGPDFTGEEACCNAGVNSLGRICSDTVGAPCVFVDETPAPTTPAPTTPAPATPAPTTPAPTTPAPTEPGSGCSSRDGGPDFTGEEACCNAGVSSLGRICSDTVGAPCVFVDETPAPTTPAPTTPAPTEPGSGCSSRDGGPDFTGEEACCNAGVNSLGRICSDTVGAPCVFVDETPAPTTPAPTTPAPATPAPTTPAPTTPAPTEPETPAPTTPAPTTPAPATPAPTTPAPATPTPTTPAPTTPAPTTPAPTEPATCMDGVPGILYKEEICCPISCGTCAGNGCSDRDGGDDFSGGDACCRSGVEDLGRVCSATVGAPCVVSDDSTCSNGLPGYETSDVCCPLSCGQCGGVGCSGRGEGCCTSDVKESGELCSVTMAAPCNIDGDVVVDDDDSTCSNGLPGYETSDVCCPLSCGQCGGVGCSGRGEGCCTSDVKESGELCSVTMAAPCNIDGDDIVDGEGCSGRDGGDSFSGSQACCVSGVRALGRDCSADVGAPCLVDEIVHYSP
eukprot:g2233.t1